MCAEVVSRHKQDFKKIDVACYINLKAAKKCIYSVMGVVNIAICNQRESLKQLGDKERLRETERQRRVAGETDRERHTERQ